jgi:hypothetical protein
VCFKQLPPPKRHEATSEMSLTLSLSARHVLREIQHQKFMARPAVYKLPAKSTLFIEFKMVQVLLSGPWALTGRGIPTSYIR